MFDRIFKNPISTSCGVIIGALQYLSMSGTQFTWKGFGAVLPTVIMGALFGDASKNK